MLIPGACANPEDRPSVRSQDGNFDARAAPVADSRLAPYAADPEHPWNRLHRALFVRTAPDGIQRVHSTDPLLYRGGRFLLEGEPHRRAIGVLDEFLSDTGERQITDSRRRLFLQRDLWATFDYVAWYPDDWVHHSHLEPAAVALRTRLASAIAHVALPAGEIDALPDNYARAVESNQYARDHDPQRPAQPFLPPDLFDPDGPWVRFHETTAEPMAQQHFAGAGGRAAHVIFLRLPQGRAATDQYLKALRPNSVRQFPPGTMVAMVRRALAIDRSAKVRLTPVTEMVQIRVYRRIPDDPRANHHGDFGEQDVYEFVLDRNRWFSGEHGLRAIGPDDPAEPFQRDGADLSDSFSGIAALKSCTMCHQAPGVHSVLSMERGLRVDRGETFRSYNWDVEMNYTVRAKVLRFDWGLLQGMLEARRKPR